MPGTQCKLYRRGAEKAGKGRGIGFAKRLHLASEMDRLRINESIVMARTSNVFARVEPEIKEQAEQVLERLGIPMPQVIRRRFLD